MRTVAVEEEMSDSNNKETERELGEFRLSSQEQLGMINEFPCQIRDSCSINAEILVVTDAYCINKEFIFSVLLDISKSWQEGPKQVKLNNFPKTTHGRAKRSFHAEWYKTFTWLEYSARKDAAYCFACRHFSLPDAAESVFTSTEGYRNWKKASFKDSGFSSHAKSENHQNAMCAWAENKKRQDSNTSLVAIMDEKNKKQLTENQNYVKALAEILIVTATENTAQRGHRGHTDSERKGIFLSMLELLAKHDPMIRKRLQNQPKNAMYTSKNDTK